MAIPICSCTILHFMYVNMLMDGTLNSKSDGAFKVWKVIKEIKILREWYLFLSRLQDVDVFHESCMCFHGFPRCSIIFQLDFHGF